MWTKLASLPNQQVIGTANIEFWSIKNNQIFHQGRKIKADIDTFEVWQGHEFIARDCNTVFFAWSKTKLDPMTLRPYHHWWLDKNGVYTEGECNLYPIKGADSSTFQYIGDNYAIDKNHAYYYNRMIKSCSHPTQLQLIEEFYATDGKQIYYAGKPLKGVNVKKWHYLTVSDKKEGYSTDGERIYWLEHKLPFVKFDEWEYLINHYSKGKKHVYHMAWVEKNQNPIDWDIQTVIDFEKEQKRLAEESYQAILKQLGHIECES